MSNVYSEYREKIKSGDLIATSISGVRSFHDLQVQAIRVFDKSEFVHVGVVWRVSKRLFLLESVTPYVRIIPLSSLDEFYHIPLRKPMSNKELEFALSEVGIGKYSKWQAVKGFFGTLKIGADRLYQCAEYVIACRKLSDVNLGDIATPSEVVHSALQQGYSINYVVKDT